MLRVENLSKSYGAQVLFNDLSFTVNDGERVGLVGRNGNGKTTLFNMLLGRVEPDGGSVSVPADYRIGHLEQHLKFTRDTVLAEGCLGLPEGEKDDHWKAEKILSGLGFPRADMLRHPSEFSGGFQIRLNLAKVLVSRPNLLLLDEPNNYLDIVAIRWLTGFLRAWKGELMLITHDRRFMDSVVTHVIALHRQKARKITGGTEKMYDQIAQDEEIYEKTRLNDEKKRRQTELFIRRFRAKARLGGLVQSRVKCLAKQEKKDSLEKVGSLEFSFSGIPFPGAQMMSIYNLRFGYDAAKPLIDGISFSVGRGERIGVIGRNGRGKSTLLRLLAGELHPQAGSIKTHPELRSGYFAQTNVARLNEQKTVFEEIMAADPDALPQRARNIAGALMFGGDLMLKTVGVLSGGERNRVLLGKLLMTPAHLLILDEPTNHLDMESCDALIEAAGDFEGSLVMVTHNEMLLHALADRLIIFDDGRVTLFEGTYREFLEQEGWADEKDENRDKGPGAGKDGRRLIKQKKAALLQERSRSLRPYEEEIMTLEAAITSLENELDEANELMVKASMEQDKAALAELPKKCRLLRPRIEGLYDRLDRATKGLEGLNAAYREKLEALSLPPGD